MAAPPVEVAIAQEQTERPDSIQYWKAKYEKAAIFEGLAIDAVTDLQKWAQMYQKLADKCAASGNDETNDPALALQVAGQGQAYKLVARTFRSMADDVSLGKAPSGVGVLDRMYDVFLDMEKQRNGE